MYTSCPECHRQYRVLAAQLSAAGGMVRCGFCGEKFDALLYLSDNLSSDTGDAAIPGPAFSEEAVTGQRPLGREKLKISDEDLPEILKEPASTGTGKGPRLIWSLGTLVVLLVLAAQLAWFNRDHLLNTWPTLRPWAQKLCAELGCKVIREYRTADIKLLNRDVRLHPRYADTLLVNATMANYSDRIQPFPDIQFALFDTSGRMIAERKFKPEEYLDNSIPVADGMASRQPVHFVLEVTGPTTGAVSFEFRFL